MTPTSLLSLSRSIRDMVFGSILESLTGILAHLFVARKNLRAHHGL
jgi:hypothetical protein